MGDFFANNRKSGETATIRARRDQEDKRKELLAATKADFMKHHYAQWEHSSQKLIDDTNVHRISLRLHAEAKRNLEARRQKMSELILREEEQHRKEIVDCIETPVERNQRLMSHARKLKEEREYKRVEFAQEQYMRMWRNGCDDLRTLDSEAFKEYIKAEQLKQKQEKRIVNANLKEEEDRWARLWEEDRRQKLKREEEQAYRRGLQIADTKSSIMRQIAIKQELKEQDEIRNAEEREMWIAQMRADEERARKSREEEEEKKRKLGREVMQFNEEFLAKKKAEWEANREAERQEMLEKLAKFEKDEMQSKANIHAMQMEMQAYRNYLMERRAEEKRLERELERLTKEHLDSVNKKQDDVWERERHARENLMNEVLRVRDEQVKAKQEYKLRSEKERLLEKNMMNQELIKAKQKDEDEERKHMEVQLKRKMDLERQVQAKANQRALEAAAIAQEDAAAAIAERQYREFVRREVGRHKTQLAAPK